MLVCASTKRQQLILYSSSVDLKDEISAQQLLYLDSLEIGLEEQYMYYASGSMFMFTLTPLTPASRLGCTHHQSTMKNQRMCLVPFNLVPATSRYSMAYWVYAHTHLPSRCLYRFLSLFCLLHRNPGDWKLERVQGRTWKGSHVNDDRHLDDLLMYDSLSKVVSAFDSRSREWRWTRGQARARKGLS